jgi:hypothetical protein
VWALTHASIADRVYVSTPHLHAGEGLGESPLNTENYIGIDDFLPIAALQKPRIATTIPTMTKFVVEPPSPINGEMRIQRPKIPLTQLCHIDIERDVLHT